ncbi:hypothetical protein [Solimonas marina]|uniref:Uncharacterized protein n=1 Tax=Solimonas marina TaxID=2714601 RepID=A0A970B759_9GAMM|nr:hypothetical protein [Solimonas marina]NKF20874.1 hypothetical protein [Solimonas marina]
MQGLKEWSGDIGAQTPRAGRQYMASRSRARTWGQRARLALSLAALAVISGCAGGVVPNYSIGDLLSGGPPPLQGDPQTTGLVLVDVDLTPPPGEMIDMDYGLSDVGAYLERVSDGARIDFIDQRGSRALFSNVPPGDYRFVMEKSVTRNTFPKSDYYKKPKKRELHRQHYDYHRGNAWKTIITVRAGTPVYHGLIMIPPEHAELFSIGPSLDDDEQAAPGDVTIVHSAAEEKKAWNMYFQTLYRNSAWAPRVQQRIAELG